jgi:hypothetical protein
MAVQHGSFFGSFLLDRVVDWKEAVCKRTPLENWSFFGSFFLPRKKEHAR